MPKNPNQKLKLLYIKDYLEKCSDEEHIVSTADIILHLANNGISAERKSIYDDIEALCAYGMDIISVKGKKAGYYLASRELEIPELKLLVDAVTAAKFLTAKKSKHIIDSVSAFASSFQAKELERGFFVPSRVTAQNETVFYNVDAIHTAISERRDIRFRYTEWKLNFGGRNRIERVSRRDGKEYTIFPCELVWDDEYYYLIGYDEDKKAIKHFRVDKMERTVVADKPESLPEEVNKFNITDYVGGVFGMFGGREESVTVLFDNSLIGVVADRFGSNASVRKHDDNSFELSFKAQISPQFFAFIFGCGAKAKILAPESVADEYYEIIKGVAARY